MDKKGALDAIRTAARLLGSSENSWIIDAAHWLEQTETVPEVREALERASERLGGKPGDHVYVMECRGSPRVDGVHETSIRAACMGAVGGPSLVKCIDEIAAEPSDEPPNHGDIKPGTEAVTKGGYHAVLYPYHAGFTGVWNWKGNWHPAFWDGAGVCTDHHLTDHEPVNIDWRATRRAWEETNA